MSSCWSGNYSAFKVITHAVGKQSAYEVPLFCLKLFYNINIWRVEITVILGKHWVEGFLKCCATQKRWMAMRIKYRLQWFS